MEVERKTETEIKTGKIPNVFTSQFFDRGEAVTITPPTGEDKNYVVPIIIEITSLIIIGLGIIIIKKKVL